MDNITIRSVEKYLHEKLQGSDSGNYLIVEVEGIHDDDLDDKAVALDELCTQHGASSVLVADHNKIWQARKAFAKQSAPKASSSAKKTSSSPSTRNRSCWRKFSAWPVNTA